MKRKTAFNLAISIVRKHRNLHYSVGEALFIRGIDAHFAKRDHKNYKRLSAVIEILEKELSQGE